jgi:hypothetical protein
MQLSISQKSNLSPMTSAFQDVPSKYKEKMTCNVCVLIVVSFEQLEAYTEKNTDGHEEIWI